METFHFTLLTPGGKKSDDRLWQLSARSSTGDFSVRAHHETYIATLTQGYIEAAFSPDRRMKIAIESGILRFKNNTCTILTPKAEVQ